MMRLRGDHEICPTRQEHRVFDRYSGDYQKVLSRGVRWSGEDHEYFVRDKLERIRVVLGGNLIRHILEVGCGIGLLTESLGRAFPSCLVTGLDVSAKSLEVASGRCRDLKNVSFRLFDGLSFPGGVEKSELIVLANVLHHIDPGFRQSFVESVVLAGVRPSGKVVVFEHNPFNPLTRYVVKTCPFDRGVRLLSAHTVTALLRRSGFSVIERDYILFFPRPLGFLRRLEPRLRRFPLGAQYMMVGESRRGEHESAVGSLRSGI